MKKYEEIKFVTFPGALFTIPKDSLRFILSYENEIFINLITNQEIVFENIQLVNELKFLFNEYKNINIDGFLDIDSTFYIIDTFLKNCNIVSKKRNRLLLLIKEVNSKKFFKLKFVKYVKVSNHKLFKDHVNKKLNEFPNLKLIYRVDKALNPNTINKKEYILKIENVI